MSAVWLLSLAAALTADLLFMTVLWQIGRKMGNAGIVDVAWSACIAVLALFYVCLHEGYFVRSMLSLVLVFGWGLRLAVFIHWRGRNEGEDPRYRRLKDNWGDKADQKMLSFYLIQGAAAALFSIPFLSISMNTLTRIHMLEWAAALLWLAAWAGETAADLQLREHKENPANRGKTCRKGLWRFSRHPNYFFEWLIWCAFALFALPSPGGWTALICPAFMYHFLVHVTGIPTTEQQALQSRGDDYRRYQKTTSAFFPWFPKKTKCEDRNVD